MSVIDRLKAFLYRVRDWIREKVFRQQDRPPHSRDKTPMPVTNFTAEIEQ